MFSLLSLLSLSTLTLAAPAGPVSLQKGLGNGIKYLGRVNPATLELTWPSTGVAFAFSGTTAIIGVDASSIIGNNSAALYIDGSEAIDIPTVVGDIVIPTLAQGEHTVELRKRSETAYGTFALTGVTTDGSISTGADKIQLPNRQIEIIGDSISVGYGIDGVFPCVNTAAEENAEETYGARAAMALNADYSIVAWSGKGLIRNYLLPANDTSPIMPELWTRYGANDADGSYTFPSYWNPQVVVIALGTNDFGYLATNSTGGQSPIRPPVMKKQFTDAAVKFIEEVSGHYKRAQFFLMGSPLLSGDQHDQDNSYWTAAASQVSAKGIKAQFVDWPTQGPVYGCDYHPNALTHAAEGFVLTEAIQAALSW